MNQLKTLTILLFSVGHLAACASPAAVVPSPTAVLAQSTASGLTPTALDPTAVASPTPLPTFTPTPFPTATAAPSPTATSVPLTILQPQNQALFPAGAAVTVSGVDETAIHLPLSITASIGDWLLAEAETTVDANGTWEATLAMPPQISGPSTIAVLVHGTQEKATVDVTLEAAIDENATFVQLEKPRPDDKAVAGYAIFFAGEINLPISRTLEIGILHDGCSRFATRQVFELGNGRWQGMMVLPTDITGRACAIARTGNPEERDGWQAVVHPLSILPLGDENAPQITLGNADELVFSGSEPVELFGTAVQAVNNEVHLLLNSDDGTYQLLAMETISANSFGLWALSLQLEEPYVGPALLTVSTGTGDEYTELRVPVTFIR